MDKIAALQPLIGPCWIVAATNCNCSSQTSGVRQGLQDGS